MQYRKLFKSEPMRLDRSSVSTPHPLITCVDLNKLYNLMGGLKSLKLITKYKFICCIVSVAFVCLFMYDLHHRRGMNIKEATMTTGKLQKAATEVTSAVVKDQKEQLRLKRHSSTSVKLVDFREADF